MLIIVIHAADNRAVLIPPSALLPLSTTNTVPDVLLDVPCRRVATLTVTHGGAQSSYPRDADLPPELRLP